MRQQPTRASSQSPNLVRHIHEPSQAQSPIDATTELLAKIDTFTSQRPNSTDTKDKKKQNESALMEQNESTLIEINKALLNLSQPSDRSYKNALLKLIQSSDDSYERARTCLIEHIKRTESCRQQLNAVKRMVSPSNFFGVFSQSHYFTSLSSGTEQGEPERKRAFSLYSDVSEQRQAFIQLINDTIKLLRTLSQKLSHTLYVIYKKVPELDSLSATPPVLYRSEHAPANLVENPFIPLINELLMLEYRTKIFEEKAVTIHNTDDLESELQERKEAIIDKINKVNEDAGLSIDMPERVDDHYYYPRSALMVAMEKLSNISYLLGQQGAFALPIEREIKQALEEVVKALVKKGACFTRHLKLNDDINNDLDPFHVNNNDQGNGDNRCIKLTALANLHQHHPSHFIANQIVMSTSLQELLWILETIGRSRFFSKPRNITMPVAPSPLGTTQIDQAEASIHVLRDSHYWRRKNTPGIATLIACALFNEIKLEHCSDKEVLQFRDSHLLDALPKSLNHVLLDLCLFAHLESFNSNFSQAKHDGDGTKKQLIAEQLLTHVKPHINTMNIKDRITFHNLMLCFQLTSQSKSKCDIEHAGGKEREPMYDPLILSLVSRFLINDKSMVKKIRVASKAHRAMLSM